MKKDEAIHRHQDLQDIFDEFYAAHQSVLIENGQLKSENSRLKELLKQNHIQPLTYDEKF